MDYDTEYFYNESILFSGTGPEPQQEYFYNESDLEWELTLGVILDHLSLRGAKIR